MSEVTDWRWPAPILLVLSLVLLSSIRTLFSTFSTPQYPLPSGPRALSLIGNIHQLPPSKATQWRLFDVWKQTFGPIFRLFAGNDTIIVVGDYATAHELLDRRAANFSSRPRLPFTNDLLYKGNLHFLLRPYGEQFKLHRRMADRFFTPSASQGYRPLHEYESLRLLRYLLDHLDSSSSTSSSSPNTNNQHTQYYIFAHATSRFAASVVMMLMYGYPVHTGHEAPISKAKLANDRLLHALSSVWPCDVFPWLNQFPAAVSWLLPRHMPFRSLLEDLFTPWWKKQAAEWFEFQRCHHLEDLDRAKAAKGWNVAKALAGSKEASMPAFASSSSSSSTSSYPSPNPDNGKWKSSSSSSSSSSDLHVAYDAGIISDAGVDTTASTLMMFLLAAVAHPDAVRKAQAEIDGVVGGNVESRLPGFADKSSLPYVHAFLNEVLRWRPVFPGGIPHANLHEDLLQVDGHNRDIDLSAEEKASPRTYRIPRGSVVVANVWSIHMDKATYGDDADSFRPERWLENPRLPMVGFGFGRRVCLGQHVARDELFVAIARLLWAFDFEAGEDMDKVKLVETMLVQPEPFRFGLKVRGGEKGVVRAVVEETEAEVARKGEVKWRPDE